MGLWVLGGLLGIRWVIGLGGGGGGSQLLGIRWGHRALVGLWSLGWVMGPW